MKRKRTVWPVLYVGADHGGLRHKQAVVHWCERNLVPYMDQGAFVYDSTDDYPVFAQRVCRSVADHPGSRGLLMCRTGIGMAMVANKIPGIRAAVAWSRRIAKQSRRDEDANVLALPADSLSVAEAVVIVKDWLQEPYRPLRRFERRLQQIRRMEHGSRSA